MKQKVLKFLAGGPATATPLANNTKLLLERDDAKRLAIDLAALEVLARSELVVRTGAKIELSALGRANVVRAAVTENPFGNQHRDLGAAIIMERDERISVTMNHNESPLANLARRKDRAGRAFLSEREFAAGERLRADYTRGQIMPRMGANWEASISSGRRDGGNGVADLTDAALASRQRVEAATEAVGPELAGVLVDVCCFLKGLETVESERGWPVRSAKIMLKAALSTLARHYEPEPSSRRARTRHWGAADYRPVNGGISAS